MTFDLNGFREWVPSIALLAGWLVAATVAWRRIHEKINGLGGRTNALELTVGSHETTLDANDTTLRDSANDRRILFERVGELRAEVAAIRKAADERDSRTEQTLTEIKVELGKLGTKVDFLIEEKMK